METFKNPKTGATTIRGQAVTVVVEENGRVTLTYPDGSVVHIPEGSTHTDEPSPRAAGKNRKRGSR
jgi:hypothetical protein